jgi:hypothetical protein
MVWGFMLTNHQSTDRLGDALVVKEVFANPEPPTTGLSAKAAGKREAGGAIEAGLSKKRVRHEEATAPVEEQFQHSVLEKEEEVVVLGSRYNLRKIKATAESAQRKAKKKARPVKTVAPAQARPLRKEPEGSNRQQYDEAEPRRSVRVAGNASSSKAPPTKIDASPSRVESSGPKSVLGKHSGHSSIEPNEAKKRSRAEMTIDDAGEPMLANNATKEPSRIAENSNKRKLDIDHEPSARHRRARSQDNENLQHLASIDLPQLTAPPKSPRVDDLYDDNHSVLAELESHRRYMYDSCSKKVRGGYR